jgi:sugar-phosphatase
MVEAVIFDMDGLLVRSEQYWKSGEQQILKRYGVQMTPEKILEATGLGTDDAFEFWYRLKPWPDFNPKALKKELFEYVKERFREDGEMMPGAKYILEFFNNRGIKMALASGAPAEIIDVVIDKTGIRKYFKIISTAHDEEYNKPHPAVYITTAKKLNVNPVNCLVFEDSFNGLLAAKSARMKTVCIPDPQFYNFKGFVIADLVLGSLNDFNDNHFAFLNNLK